VELCIRKQPSAQAPQAGPVPLRRISHVRIEVTDLEEARDWYNNTFGLIVGEQVPGENQLTMTVAKSNQFVILRDVDKVADRSTQCFKGPHIDLRSDESHPAAHAPNRKDLLGPIPISSVAWPEPTPPTATDPLTTHSGASSPSPVPRRNRAPHSSNSPTCWS
jgi:hypothetical protein